MLHGSCGWLFRCRSNGAAQDETIQAVVEEIKALARELACMREDHTLEQQATPYIVSNLVVHHTSILRNKRCILALL